MNAEQAWQSVLGQLQMEMPRASFDTWVRGTSPLTYEDGVMAIAVRNAYARDWLENRLLSTVTRLLAGMMNRAVDVRFVVASEHDTVEGEDRKSVV
jgi:chromosomal replication initiator protein